MAGAREISASGVDEALANLSADAYGTYPAGSMGLRVPSLATSNPANRYLFQLATLDVDVANPVRLVGWRQFISIGMNLATTGIPLAPIELEVKTPHWRFLDGNWSFHLVKEAFMGVGSKPTASNFSPGRCKGSALLYGSATFSAGNADANGNPYYYQVGMTAYTPPAGITASWQDVVGLSNVQDLRAPYSDARVWGSLNVIVRGPCRLSLYASIAQTSPSTRTALVFPSGEPEATTTPEEYFVKTYSGGGAGPIVWRVGGSLIIEDINGD